MSDEWDDDDVWDDPEPVVEQIIRKITINTLSRSQINEIEKGLILCVEQKLEKLNVILRNMNVYAVGDQLLINDRYNVCPQIIEIIKAFGMDVQPIQVPGMRGKCYVVSDAVVSLLGRLSSDYAFGKSIANCTATGNVQDAVRANAIVYPSLLTAYDSELVQFIKQIRNDGTLEIEGVETLIDSVSQGIVSDARRVEGKLQDFLSAIGKHVAENNLNMRNGTTEILYHRARQMGYSVEKTVKGKEVQLVLVRLG